ncbi:BCCT family transporter [Alkalicoccus urumqiensis]|uniref:Choline transporter n=1 Tax=Alkalicoccus urumqiensis TaxID=1548213 RepID=A0A2P6MLX0_ALKUR|nr:BCCT family transporter [Alkalicoccus urumqiensis]PRO67275.1 choline transporter [Alkalicoccus urumqiensis]
MDKDERGRLIDYRIFLPALLIVILISLPLSLYESASLDVLNRIFDEIVRAFSWGYIWYAIILLGFGLYLSFSKYGNVVLGDPAQKPRFSLFEYASILIAMGVGSTIMRTGMVAWTGVANDPPFGMEAGSTEALLMGNAYSMFMWSFQVFAIFVMAAPAMAYILHVRKRPLMRISEACRVLFGDRFTDGFGGKVLDIIFLVSILSGAAVTLGLGTPIVTHNLARLFDLQMTFTLTLGVTLLWVILFSLSAYLGIERGIKRLSTFNMYLAAGFAVFVMLFGPGVFILDYFTDSLRTLVTNYVDISLYTDSLALGDATYMQTNTVFWFAYSATWAMLHSIFAAKISEGRTIKEMIMTYLLAPTMLSWLATGVLGGLAVHRHVTGSLDVLALTENGEPVAAIPEILSTLPFGEIALVVFMIVAMIFLTTTLDSTTYTIAAYTSTRNMAENEPSRKLRIIVAAIIAAVALVLMRIGGLPPLEVVSGLLGLPIILLQFCTIAAIIIMLRQDRAWENNVRK